MTKKLLLFLTILLGFIQSSYAYNKLVEYSEATDVIEISEQLSEWHPSLAKDLLTYWRSKFGELSSEDKSFLSRYREIRKKLTLKTPFKDQPGDLIFGQLNPTYDYFTYCFYSSLSVSEALRKLSKKLPKAEVKELTLFFKHFLPKMSQLVSESTAFRQKSKELQDRLKKEKASQVLKELEKFVSQKGVKVKDLRALLVWWPKTSKPKIEVKGKYVLIRINPLQELSELDTSKLLGSMIDAYFGGLSPNFKNNFAKTFKEKCPGREKDFHDSFLTVYKDIKSSFFEDKKKFSLFKKWSEQPFVNQYAKLLYVLIQEEVKKKQKMGGSFAHDASLLCSEIHQLATATSL